MRIGWVNLDGTNTWETVSTLGTSIDIRVGFFKKFIERGDTIHWFGIKKNSDLLEGEQVSNIKPHFHHLRVLKEIRYFTRMWETAPRNGSKSKWVAEHVMDAILHEMELGDIKMPKCDVVIAEYMDTGMHQLILFAAVLAYYARRDVPLYVRDPERRFRYVTELTQLGYEPRNNMYEHRLQRYISQETVDLLRGRIRMIYPFSAKSWDDGTDGFYRSTPIEVAVLYDRAREIRPTRIPSVQTKRRSPVVMVGNDNKRRPFIEQWYGGLKHHADIYGNWRNRDAEYVKSWRKINKRVKFHDPVSQTEALEVLSEGLATIYHLPPMSIALGQLTYRLCEASFAGTINISPWVIPRCREFTLDDFIVEDVDDLNNTIDFLMGLKNRQYRELVHEQRQKVFNNFNVTKVFRYFIGELEEDGVNV